MYSIVYRRIRMDANVLRLLLARPGNTFAPPNNVVTEREL